MKINVVKNSIKTLNDKRLSTVAGAWVFYFLTSVIPLAFLLITAFGVFGVDVASDFVSRLPEEFRPAGESILLTASRASNGATILFIATAVYSCVRLLNQMSKDGDCIYSKKSSKKRGFMRRIWAFFALGSLFSVFLGCALITAFGGELFSFSIFGGSVKRLITAVVVSFSVIAVSFIIIVMLNVFISPVKLKFRGVALGSLFSLFAIVLGTLGFAVYVRVFNSYNAFYGSLAGIIVFLLWVYIVMVSLVLGVIINAKAYEKGRKTL